jgi:peroxiredoxin
MAVETKNISIGFKAADFKLPDVVSGKEISLEQLRGTEATVVMFICNHCPYVKHVIKGIVDVAATYKDKLVSFIAINSNDADKYPDDAPDKMKEFSMENNFSFPYLYDETQDVARSYEAACTPEFYLFDRELRLKYHGQMDDSRPGNNKPVTGKDLRNAIDNVLSGKEVNAEQKPSIGCSIKWK